MMKQQLKSKQTIPLADGMCSTDMLTIDNTRGESCPLEQKEDLSFFRNSGWVVVSRDSREVVHFRLIEWLFLECSGWISTQNSGDSWNNALHQSSEVYFNHWWSIWSTWIWLLTWRWNPAVRTKRLWNLIKIQRVTTVLFMALQTSPKFVQVVSWKRNKKGTPFRENFTSGDIDDSTVPTLLQIQ